MQAPALYKSEAAKTHFEIAYQALLDSWTIDFESHWVDTDFGATHVLLTGTPGATAAVMLPGAQGTAGMWGGVAQALASKHRIYCLDLIDQVGLSRPTRVLSSSDDADWWLNQVLDALEAERADLIGNSLGAFIASKFAAAYPGRVNKLVLTAPAATVAAINPGYIVKVLVSMNLPGAYLKNRFLLSTGAGHVDRDDPLFRVLQAAMLGGRVVSKLLPRALKPEELTALTMPVLLIQGLQDTVNAGNPEAVCEALRASVPQLTCAVLADAGHLWTPAHFEQAGRLIGDFL